MKIAFLTEGGKGIGSGHIARTTAFADAFYSQGYFDITFIIRGKGVKFNHRRPYHIDYQNWLYANASDLLVYDVIIIDSYSNEYHKYDLLSTPYNTIVSICDYTNNYSRADVTYIPSIYGEKSEIQSKYQGSKIVIGGTNYLLFRKEFWNIDCIKIKPKIKKIGVSLGSSGIDSVVSRLEKTKEILGEDVIILLFGEVEPRYNSIIEKNGINILGFLDTIAYINQLKKLDFLITNGGQTLNEALLLGLPTISMVTEKNQELNVNEATNKQLTVELDFEASTIEIHKALNKMLHYQFRIELAHRLRNTINHMGGKKAVNEIINNL